MLFRAFLSGSPKNTKKTILQRVLLSEVVFEGGIFVQIPFLLGSFGPLPPKDGLETPIFIVFSPFFGSDIFRFPEARPYDVFIDFWGFGNLGPKNAQKNSETRGANSVARIPSSFSRGVYSFFG